MAETEESSGAMTGRSRPEGAAKNPGPPVGQAVDLETLAERVYGLLKEEARLERERLG